MIFTPLDCLLRLAERVQQTKIVVHSESGTPMEFAQSLGLYTYAPGQMRQAISWLKRPPTIDSFFTRRFLVIWLTG